MADDMRARVAQAMKQRASQPVANLSSLEPVLVGSLGDAWMYLAEAAIAEMYEPTEEMVAAGECLETFAYTDDGNGINIPARPAETWEAMMGVARGGNV